MGNDARIDLDQLSRLWFASASGAERCRLGNVGSLETRSRRHRQTRGNGCSKPLGYVPAQIAGWFGLARWERRARLLALPI